MLICRPVAPDIVSCPSSARGSSPDAAPEAYHCRQSYCRLIFPARRRDALHDAPSGHQSAAHRWFPICFISASFIACRISILSSDSDERDCSYVQSALSLPVDDTRKVSSDSMFRFMTLRPRNTSPSSSSAYSNGPFLREAPLVTMLRAVIATLMLRRAGRNMLNAAVDNLLRQTSAVQRADLAFQLLIAGADRVAL